MKKGSPKPHPTLQSFTLLGGHCFSQRSRPKLKLYGSWGQDLQEESVWGFTLVQEQGPPLPLLYAGCIYHGFFHLLGLLTGEESQGSYGAEASVWAVLEFRVGSWLMWLVERSEKWLQVDEVHAFIHSFIHPTNMCWLKLRDRHWKNEIKAMSSVLVSISAAVLNYLNPDKPGAKGFVSFTA